MVMAILLIEIVGWIGAALCSYSLFFDYP